MRGGDSMLKLCRTCKYDWDGHCTIGYDNWKQNKAKEDDDCGEFEERGVNDAKKKEATGHNPFCRR